MANRFSLFLENLNIVITKQYGFRQNRSTIHAMDDFITTVEDSVDKIKISVAMCF